MTTTNRQLYVCEGCLAELKGEPEPIIQGYILICQTAFQCGRFQVKIKSHNIYIITRLEELGYITTTDAFFDDEESIFVRPNGMREVEINGVVNCVAICKTISELKELVDE